MKVKLFFFFMIAISAIFQSCNRPQPEESDEVIEIFKKESLYRKDVNWDLVKIEIDSLKRINRNLGTRKICEHILEMIGDNHGSFFVEKFKYDFVQPADRNDLEPITIYYCLTEDEVGYIELRYCSGPNDSVKEQLFIHNIRNAISSLDSGNLIGWILDLRLNRGGGMWLPLAGLLPLLDSDTLGYFVDADSNYLPWVSSKNAMYIGNEIEVKFDPVPIGLKHTHKKIAILLDRKTASAAEAIAIAFYGQSNVKFFGEPTGGFATGPEGFPLKGGGILKMATCYMTTRNKIVMRGKIPPDFYTLDEDPVKIATSWIKEN